VSGGVSHTSAYPPTSFFMNKTLLRILSIILVPCLMGDPVTAAGLGDLLGGSRPPMTANRVAYGQASRIQEEALSSAGL
jgi:hypothetical protein